MTLFLYLRCHVDRVATKVCLGRVFDQKSAGVGARLVPIHDQVVKILLLKFKPFLSRGLVVLQVHLVTQLF